MAGSARVRSDGGNTGARQCGRCRVFFRAPSRACTCVWKLDRPGVRQRQYSRVFTAAYAHIPSTELCDGRGRLHPIGASDQSALGWTLPIRLPARQSGSFGTYA